MSRVESLHVLIKEKDLRKIDSWLPQHALTEGRIGDKQWQLVLIGQRK
jgi:hypothetical protein